MSSIFNLFKSFRIAFCIDLSNAETHSSQIISSGFKLNARAITTLCLSPPESSDGYLLNKCFLSSTLFKYSIANVFA